MSDDQIAKTLDLVPLQQLPVAVSQNEAQVNDDFEYARGNLIAAIEKGQEALTDIVSVAGMSQHPRAYEVVATLLKTVADANKDLLELQKRKRDLTGESLSPPTTVNNNLFVGSTTELQQLIKKQRNEQKDQ
jgi:hypothetical protein